MQELQGPPLAPMHNAALRRAHFMREVVETLLFVGLVFLIVHFAVNPYRVTGTNMAPQLQPDQIIVVNRVAYVFSGPSRGDVVVYVDPADTSKQLIGRVIAVPGDTIAITASGVQVNGVNLNETYVQEVTGGNGEPLVVANTKLKTDHYWIMNDSRLAEDISGQFEDSRGFGPIARQNIIGRAAIIFWPLNNFSGISNFSNVFKGVH